MNDQTLARAQAGDEPAFHELTDPYRRSRQLDCRRILGSVQDGENALGQTLVAARRSLDSRSATSTPAPRESEFPEPTRRLEATWIEHSGLRRADLVARERER